MTHIFNKIMDGGYFMAFGTLSPIQQRCKEFTEATLQEVLAIRQRERYLNNIKACITGYPPADEEEPFVPENFSQYQFFLPFEEIIDYTDRFDFLMCCLAAGVCKVHKGFEERYQQSLLKVLTFRATTNPTTPLGYILSPELLPIVRYEEDDDDEVEEENGGQNDDEDTTTAQLLIGAQAGGDDGTAVTPSRPTTSSNGAGGGGELIVVPGMELAVATTPTSQQQHGGATPTSSPTRSNQKGRKILTEKEQVLNDADFDTSGLTVQEIDAERARRKALQSSIIDEYISNKDSYVLSLKEELKRLLAEEEEEARNGSNGRGGISNAPTPPTAISDVDGDTTTNPVTTTPSAMDVIAAPKDEAVSSPSSTPSTTNTDNVAAAPKEGVVGGSVLELVLRCKADHVAESELAAAPVDENTDEL